MPTPTYTPIATITLTSSDSEVVFSSIPATYRDLILVFAGSTVYLSGVVVNFNGDNTGTNISQVRMYGPTGSDTLIGHPGIDFAYSTVQSTTIMQILDYSATDKHKSCLVRWNSAGGSDLTVAVAARWANTAAINSIRIYNSSGFTSGSTFSLYGVIA